MLWLQLIALALLGAMSVTFAATTNSLLQLSVEPGLRGRVMSLYTVVFLGSTPIGAPLVGWMAQVAGPRSGLLLGAIAALATGLVARIAFARADVPVSAPPSPCAAEGRRHAARPAARRRRPERPPGAAAPRRARPPPARHRPTRRS